MDGCVLGSGVRWLVIMDITAISVPLCLSWLLAAGSRPARSPSSPSPRSGQAVTSVVSGGRELWSLSPPRAERRPLIGSLQRPGCAGLRAQSKAWTGVRKDRRGGGPGG